MAAILVPTAADAHFPPLQLLFRVFVLGAGVSLSYVVWSIIYNLFLHPLHNYPGPKLWAISPVFYAHAWLSGRSHERILALHEQYGPVVRVGPNDLVFSHPDAWPQIMGHRKADAAEHGKDPSFMFDNMQSIIGAPRAEHARMRRAVAHGFSAQAMLEQQPIIRGYVDLLFQRLREHCCTPVPGTPHEKGDEPTPVVPQPLDMAAWFNWTTFDIIGDLAFGEPFNCLRSSDYHPWVRNIFASARALLVTVMTRRVPLLAAIARLRRQSSAELMAKREQHRALTRETTGKRLASGSTSRPDFVGAMVGRLSRAEIEATASTLVVAGSETTATVLTATTFYLGMHPDVLEKLNAEVRGAFGREEEIDLVSVQKLPYMLAVLNESMRMYPPVPSAIPRRIAKGGETVLGKFVPEGTSVYLWHWPAYHNPKYFAQPDDFIPERWTGDERFAADARDVFQPFSFGARNCVGKNLAYAEMRMILARLVWNFDLRLDASARTFNVDSKSYFFWDKGPLNVFLTPRKINSEVAEPSA